MATMKKSASKNAKPFAADKSIKVSQSTINKIKADGMKKATTKASSGKASTPYIAGTIRMYGSKRVTAAGKAPKKVAGVQGKGNAKKYTPQASLKDRYLPTWEDVKEFNNKANQANIKMAKDFAKFNTAPIRAAVKVAKKLASPKKPRK